MRELGMGPEDSEVMARVDTVAWKYVLSKALRVGIQSLRRT
jgi:hypothetical protein